MYRRIVVGLLSVALTLLCATSLSAEEKAQDPVSVRAQPPNGPWGIRVLVALAGLAAWYGTQYLIRERRPLAAAEADKAGRLLAEHDAILKLTAPINRFLNLHLR